MSISFRILVTLAMLSALGCESSTLRSQPRDKLDSNNSDVANARSQILDLSTIATSTAVSEPFISVELPTRDRPVSAAMSCQIVSDNDDSTVVEVWIKVKIARGHYVYASGDDQGPFKGLSVELQLPKNSSTEGDWQFPVPISKNGHKVYFDSVVMHRQLRCSKASDSKVEATVHFQVCNEDVCYPSATLPISGSIARLN